jgi:hypothetical protein
MKNLIEKPWWGYISEDIQNLLQQSNLLYDRVEKWDEKFTDYSFIIFPAAKAYEGYLKQMFLDMNFITPEEYDGKRFRIGRALNPELEKEFRGESIYDKLATYCGGVSLPDFLWLTWKECRNSVFHWFPKNKGEMTLEEAGQKIDMIIEAIDYSTRECKLSS